jgi:hypothetical protein
MGMDRKVTLPQATVPVWAHLADFLAARQFPLKMMMIDGALSFPDEQPPDGWRELRVGTSLGMVTLCRDGDGVRVVTWGNAEGPLRQAWNAVTWGLAAVFGGAIHDQQESLSAEEFARKAELPTGLLP